MEVLLIDRRADCIPKIGNSLRKENLMKLQNYKVQAAVLAIWIVVVLLLFRTIADRQIAALIAGLGFILIPSAILISEFKGNRNKTHMALIAFFLVTAALPIFFLRLLNWGVDFNSLQLAGVPAKTLHGISNASYLVMLGWTSLLAWLRRFQK